MRDYAMVDSNELAHQDVEAGFFHAMNQHGDGAFNCRAPRYPDHQRCEVAAIVPTRKGSCL